jgi:tRNA wybutosine-synthesizing protein 3
MNSTSKNWKEWDKLKSSAWSRLLEDLHIGYLDEDILDILLEFFMRPKSFTKSSCSGRITVIDAEYPWVKDDTMTIFKKHTPVSHSEIRDVLTRPYAYRLWLSIQGPIYHVYVYDLNEAEEVLRIAREAGFKHSGIMRTEWPLLVELRTGVRGDILLADEHGPILEGEQLKRVVDIANQILSQAKNRNQRLLTTLRRRRPENFWEPALLKAKQLGVV